MSSTGEQCFSGGVDGTIQCWNTPNPNIDPYDSYGNFSVVLLNREDFQQQSMKSDCPPGFSLQQTRQCCVESSVDTLTRCGDWCTAAHTSASSPALQTEPSGCGTPTPPPLHLQCSTKTKVANRTRMVQAYPFLRLFKMKKFQLGLCFVCPSARVGSSLLSGPGMQ